MSQPQAIYLHDYQVPSYLVESIELDFELNEGQTRVHAHMQVKKNPQSTVYEWVLNGEQLELVSLAINGVAFDGYERTSETLTLSNLPDEFTLDVITLIYPEKNTALEGLYQSSGNYCTQCEAEGFRKITYYPDRPDVMALFTTRISADKAKYPFLLSNGNLIEKGDLANGRHFCVWQDPFKKPCYLFALVAGDFDWVHDQYTTMSGRVIDLDLYVEKGFAKQTPFAMQSLKKAMQWDEEVFGLEYDLDTYMIVAVSDFNMGAMENKGLNVFNTKYVLADEQCATDTDYLGVEGVIAHEYFHNWTGNRVTCRNWFQLSLKEGLTVFRDQQFSADMHSASVKRISEVNLLRERQFAEDAGPMAHPIRPASYIEMNNFYTLTVYEKGSEVIRMIHTLVGKQGFRKGMDLYFQRHDGDAVTTEDFVAAMADANQIDLRQFENWYHYAGTPEVKVSTSYNAAAQTYSLAFSQSCPATPGQPHKPNFVIPIKTALLDSSGNDMQVTGPDGTVATQFLLTLTEQMQCFTFTHVSEAPVPSMLRDFSAPIRLFHSLTDQELAFLFAHDSNEFNRWDAGQQLAHRLIQSMIAQRAAGEESVVPDYYIQAMRNIVTDEKLSDAIKAEALTFPSYVALAEQMACVDIEGLNICREQVIKTLAQQLQALWLEAYQKRNHPSEFKVDATSIGERSLKNVLLGYLSYTEQGEALCLAHYHNASNMTDRMAAFKLIAQLESEVRKSVIADFEKQWITYPLVMDKWFVVQATSNRASTLHDVKQLLTHPQFKMTNPNKVRALIGAFASNNLIAFHQADGAGYAFLADKIIELNAINPQIASRLLTPLTHWRKYDSSRQKLMLAQLQRIVQLPTLSKDVYEIASKSLS